MNKTVYERISSKEILIALVNKNDEVVWESSKSPASSLFKAYYAGELNNLGELSLYSNQAGLAVALISPELSVKECYAIRMSEVGLEKFKENQVEVHYEELIPLVKSSKDDTKVCPVERFLSEHNDEERWNYMEQNFKNATSTGVGCGIF